MPINLDEALGAELPAAEFSWTSGDIQLYHLGLGAGMDPMDPRELRYLADDTPQVLPTFGNVAQSFHMTEPPTVKFPGIDIELSKVLHASEAVTVPGPIPPSGTGRAVTRFTDIWDKGKAAVIWAETTVTAADSTLLWTQKRSISPAARVASAASEERRRARRRPTSRSICRCYRSRRCCIGCAGTAISCTPIPNSPRQRAFRVDPARLVHVRDDVQGDRRHLPGQRRELGSFLWRQVRRCSVRRFPSPMGEADWRT
jgi:hypothetical protein